MDFRQVYRRQEAFLIRVHSTAMSESERMLATKEYLHRLHVELGEVYQAAKLNKTDGTGLTLEDKSSIREELIDSFKYLLNIFLLQGMSDEDIEREFHRKSDIVEKRPR